MEKKKAVITADGLFRAFVPLSLEKPKPLWTVRGETLAERLIRQAKEAGMTDITVVIGYRKELFAYLEQKFGVSLFENKEFRTNEGAEAITAGEGAIVRSAGVYYIGNPFLDEQAEEARIGTLDELRRFDPTYKLYSGSEVLRNIRLVFRCEEDEICNFRYLDRRQTNVSFVFEIRGANYVYRHPAVGNDEYVNWKNEVRSMVIAKELGIDTTYIYADFREGWKIMEFIGPHGKPDYASFADSQKIIRVLQKLHAADVVTDYGMKPWEDAQTILESLNKIDPGAFAPYTELSETIRRLYETTIGDGVEKCFCHGDTYRPNWMMMPDGSVILIDWEYAGYSDPGIDVGFYIADAEYDIREAERFIRAYLQEDFSETKLRHFLIYTALITYFNFVWALHRRAIGEPREDVEDKFRVMLKKYVAYLAPKD